MNGTDTGLLGYRKLRTAFLLAVGLQLALLIAVFGMSVLNKQQTARALAFDHAARSLNLDFQRVSITLNSFYSELAAPNPSKPYITSLQSSLAPQVAQLDASIAQISSASSAEFMGLQSVDADSLALFASIEPGLNAFLERARSFAANDPATLKARLARPNIVDLTASRSSVVGRSLEQLYQNAIQRQKENINTLQTGNFIAIGLLLLLLLASWFWIIRPALKKHKEATLREIAYVNDLKRKNAALEQAERQSHLLYEGAMTGLRARTEFLAVISHELRTPLNAVIGFSELMKNELLGPHAVPAYRDYSNDIHKSGQHLLTIVEDILDFTRYESGQYTLEESRVSLETIFEDVQILTSGDAALEKNITIEYYDTLPAGCLLHIDRRLVLQALLNLIDNAVKFSPNNTYVMVKGRINPDGQAEILVSDQGIGLNMEDVPALLEPFQQVESAFSRKAGGVGLGLAITNKVMIAHGGTVKVRSTLGKGSHFSLVLPAQRVSMPQNMHPGKTEDVA